MPGWERSSTATHCRSSAESKKPYPRLFQIALEQLGVTPRETLMVGDRAVGDGGAASVGIATLILLPVPNHAARGLDIVPRLLDSA